MIIVRFPPYLFFICAVVHPIVSCLLNGVIQSLCSGCLCSLSAVVEHCRIIVYGFIL